MAQNPILTGNKWDTGGSIHRTNPVPTDITDIWSSYNEAVAYATNDPTAYVGQIITVVNTSNNTQQTYRIKNTAGELEPFGAGTTYENLSGSTSDTNGNYVIKGAGANTNYVLQGNGEWIAIPSGQTYATLEAGDHATNGNYVVHGPGSTTNVFLQGNGTWGTPTNTTYAELSASDHANNKDYVVKGIGTTTNANGFLRNDGTWQTPTNTTYSEFTSTDSGLVPAPTTNSNTVNFVLAGNGSWVPMQGGAGNTYTNGVGLDLSANNEFSLKMATTNELGGIKTVYNSSAASTNLLRSLNVDTSISGGYYRYYNTPYGIEAFKDGNAYVLPRSLSVGASFSDDSSVYYEESRVYTSGNYWRIMFKNNAGALPPETNNTTVYLVLKDRLPGTSSFAIRSASSNDRYAFYDNTAGHYLFQNIIDIPTNIVVAFTYNSTLGGYVFNNIPNVYQSLDQSVASGTFSEQRTYVVKGAGADTNNFLRGDGTWQPMSSGTTYATLSSSNNITTNGYVVPGAGSNANVNYILAGNGEWIQKPTGQTYDIFSQNDNGLVPAPVNPTTNYILTGNGSWVYAAKESFVFFNYAGNQISKDIYIG